MSERLIPISTYAKADNIIELNGYVSIEGIDEKIEIPEKKHLILYNFSLVSGEIVIPRNHNVLRIFLKPNIIKGHSPDDFSHLLLKGESVDKVLKLKIQVWCKNTRWCSNQISINISDAKGRKEVYFDVPMSEVKDEIIISGFVTREKGGNSNEPRKANSLHSVLSNCEDVAIQIDERKEIVGNHLPIDYEDLIDKSKIFDIKGLDNDFEIPRIKCAKEFKEYFVRDDLKTVNATFMMVMFYLLDSYLKWLIFSCKYDANDKNHKGLVETFAKYCNISKAKLVDLIEEKKYSETQTREYLILSHKLLYGLQVDSQVKYAKELKQLIKDEGK